ncbi:MAG: hypothetical protein GZ087_06780 [Flavobacterium sp.]|nr:hypothetical protein [Flavobacterium sp.]
MKPKSETDLLKERIIILEQKRADELELLKNQFRGVRESLKPAKLIKNLFHDVINSPEIKNNMAIKAISLCTGFISKKLIVGSSHNSFKKVLGSLVQFGATNMLSKNFYDLKSKANHFLKRF